MHMKKDIVIFGTSKIAEVVFDSLQNDKAAVLNPVAFCIDAEYYQEKEKLGLPVVKFEEVEKYYSPRDYDLLVAIGYHDMNGIRAQKCEEAVRKGYQLATYVHSNVVMPSTAVIGANTIILSDVSIGSFTRIGDNVFIFPNAVVAHHVTVKDHVWITSGTVIGGNATIGERCFLGINSTIAHNTEVGRHNFIGANAVVTKNTKEDSVYIVPDTPKYRLDTTRFIKMFQFD